MSQRVSRRTAGIAAVIVAVVTTAAAGANASVPKIDVTVEAQKEVVHIDAAGKKAVEMKAATEAAAGDVIVYTLRASNTGSGPAMNPRIEDPIPAGTVLVLDSVASVGSEIEASLDGGKTWQPFPATVQHKTDSGAVETVHAPAELYTTLRWILSGPLQPGDGKNVTFKVRIR